ncbi:hypothetical protein F5B19DRAFT_499519 [Rostrohypoxylon terebratum]|nr:hypothetical protein F5B19DRAFT_499519 [Rostrohypoxylon terebratum]
MAWALTPGPVGPRPDVPTPPPSPRRSAEGLVNETTPCDKNLEIGYLDEALSRRLLSEHLAFRWDVFVPLKLTTSCDSSKGTDADSQDDIYDDKLTNYSDDRGETRLHTIAYGIAPRGESGPGASNLGSSSVGKSSCSKLSTHAGAGMIRNDPSLLRASSLKQLSKDRPDLSDAGRGLSLLLVRPVASEIHSNPASSISACTGTLDRRLDVAYGMPSNHQDTCPLCGRSSSRNSPNRVIETARLAGPSLLGSEASGMVLDAAGTQLVGSLEPSCCAVY